MAEMKCPGLHQILTAPLCTHSLNVGVLLTFFFHLEIIVH